VPPFFLAWIDLGRRPENVRFSSSLRIDVHGRVFINGYNPNATKLWGKFSRRLAGLRTGRLSPSARARASSQKWDTWDGGDFLKIRPGYFVTFATRRGFSGIKSFAMKTLPALGFLATLVAFLIFPLSVEVTGSLLFAAAFVGIAISDYTRRARPLAAPLAPVVAMPVRRERFGLAA
jgi:hypothetical protein